MSFGSRLRERREALGLKQSELGKLLGITGAAIGNYENGVSSPKAEILYQVFNVLKCDANFLFQDEMQELQAEHLAPAELEHIKKYRTLDEYGTAAVDSILSIEYERCMQTARVEQPTRIIRLYQLPASAGSGEYLDDDSWEEMKIPDIPEYRGADFAVRVHGDSMMPTFANGDIVLVREQDIVLVGDIGLFAIEGEGYIKEYGKKVLISHNKEYPNIPLREGVRCFGKIIGKLR